MFKLCVQKIVIFSSLISSLKKTELCFDTKILPYAEKSWFTDPDITKCFFIIKEILISCLECHKHVDK